MTSPVASSAVPPMREPVRVLVFSGSLRADSYNTRLSKLAVRAIRQQGATVDEAAMSDFDAPSYNQDAERANTLPKAVQEFCRRLEDNDAFVIASPEYNASMPGVLKNAIDWASRYRPQPFNGKHALLMSASPSMVGGNRGLWSLRIPLEHLGARVYPDMFSLAQAHEALTSEGDFANPQLAERFTVTIAAFVDLVEAARHYPCAKKAWIEFLGEHPNAEIDRVE